jgi:hypothetical protein
MQKNVVVEPVETAQKLQKTADRSLRRGSVNDFFSLKFFTAQMPL